VTIEPPAPGKYLARELHPAAHEFYERLARDGRPSTTRCTGCDATTFPPRERCPSCGSAQEWVALPGEGRLYAFTTQEAALRFRSPAVLALAEVGGGLLPGIMEAPYESLRIGGRVQVGTRPEPDTGLTVIEFEADAA
jgi:uncharacterized OB-fold protein